MPHPAGAGRISLSAPDLQQDKLPAKTDDLLHAVSGTGRWRNRRYAVSSGVGGKTEEIRHCPAVDRSGVNGDFRPLRCSMPRRGKLRHDLFKFIPAETQHLRLMSIGTENPPQRVVEAPSPYQFTGQSAVEILQQSAAVPLQRHVVRQHPQMPPEWTFARRKKTRREFGRAVAGSRRMKRDG